VLAGELIRDFFAGVRGDVRYDDVGALGSEGPGQHPSQRPGASGDQCPAPFKAEEAVQPGHLAGSVVGSPDISAGV
jgi:hypothetical protein